MRKRKDQLMQLIVSDTIPEERLQMAIDLLLGKVPELKVIPKFVCRDDALKLLGNISAPTLYRLWNKERINLYRVCGRTLFKVEELEQAVEETAEPYKEKRKKEE